MTDDRVLSLVRSKVPFHRLPPFDGGLAQGRAPAEFDERELLMGVEVEAEHVGRENVLAALMIAMDHLAEIPDYYTRLREMEARAKDRRV